MVVASYQSLRLFAWLGLCGGGACRKSVSTAAAYRSALCRPLPVNRGGSRLGFLGFRLVWWPSNESKPRPPLHWTRLQNSTPRPLPVQNGKRKSSTSGTELFQTEHFFIYHTSLVLCVTLHLHSASWCRTSAICLRFELSIAKGNSAEPQEPQICPW